MDPHLLPVLVNPGEHLADKLLQKTAEQNGDRLLAKVRLADVIDPGTWDSTYMTFAIRAHLDFVMVSADTSHPIFAVEIDGARHRTDRTQRRRDVMKDELCQAAGLPLLRVNSEFARREGKHILLNYPCEVYYRSVAFEEAQEAGNIPGDEPFDHAMFLETDPDHGGLSFSSLDAKARAELARLHDQKKLLNYAPDAWVGGVDEWGDVRAEVYLGVGNDCALVGTATVRHFNWFGIAAIELAEEIAVLELRRDVDRWLSGEGVAWGKREFQRRFQDFVGRCQPMRTTWTSGGPASQRIPYPAFTTGGGFRVSTVDETRVCDVSGQSQAGCCG